MKTLTVELTDDQYERFKMAMQDLCGGDVTDENLIAQLKREASAITYTSENKSNNTNLAWSF